MLRAAGRTASVQLRARSVLRHHARSMSLDERAGAPGVARLDRGFIQLLGPDAVDFLQGLTTNDVTELDLSDHPEKSGGSACQFTSMLHPKGSLPCQSPPPPPTALLTNRDRRACAVGDVCVGAPGTSSGRRRACAP